MDNILQIKSLASSSLEKRSFFLESIVSPKRDWRILLIIFSILVITSIAFDFYMYQKIVSGDMYVSVKKDELVIESLKSEDLKNINDNFEFKVVNITKLKLENLVDPSI